MKVIQYEKDHDNIVHLIMDRPNASANLMDDHFRTSMQDFITQVTTDDNVAGIIVRSTKKTFFAGGDLTALSQVTEEHAERFFNTVEATKASLRALETLGKPVVACINGAALGGGWEMALACHYRIALSDGVVLGLPEVTLGLLPGGGGVVRMTRLLGLQAAMPYLLEGKQFKPEKGIELGLINDVVDSPEAMLNRARAFILDNPDSQQPYDKDGYKIPGGIPGHPALSQMLPVSPAMLRNKTKGVLPAPEAILCVAVEGLQTDLETASRIESRYFTELATGQIAKNMIGTFWFQLNELKAGGNRPNNIDTQKCKKVGVLGAGMMGAGIAYACAIKGIDVILKDVTVEAAEKGKAYSEKILNKRVSQSRLSSDKRNEVLSRIMTTTSASDLEGCELVIEAVFEDRELKANVTREAEAHISTNAVFASNTSTLPISGLAQASNRAENFIGLHFFSPVDKMPLVEIIQGEKTSPLTLAKSFDFVLQIGKTPIVVNDSRGFFTSRVFGTFTSEGMTMLSEGISAASIENGAFLTGFPVGPLAVTDEVSMTLIAKVRNQTIEDMQAQGIDYKVHPTDAIVDRMLEFNRAGKNHGSGFYDYPENSKKRLWPGLAEHFYKSDSQIPFEDIKDRLLFVQAIETVRCFEEKVLTTVRDANIGSIMGIGCSVWTGGLLQFINQYGLNLFIDRAQQLANQYGDRFNPPELLFRMAKNQEIFKD